MIIPARSASWAVSGEKGCFRCRVTVLPLASIDAIGEISLARTEPWERQVPLERLLDGGSASSAVPSLNLTPQRILIV